MRIISGTHRGRLIHPPKTLRARPTTDFAKESIFNVLGNLIDFDGADALDLFSGTGSISYEFASRGAASVTSVEVNAVHHRYIKTTAAQFGFTSITAVRANAFLYLKSCGRQFDIIFSDAPYDLEGADQVVVLSLGRNLLKPNGLLVVEHSANTKFASHLAFKFEKVYGSVHFSVFGS